MIVKLRVKNRGRGKEREGFHSEFYCILGSVLAACSYLIEVTLVTCEKSVVQFDSTKHRRFSPGTMVFSFTDTGIM